MSKKKDGLIEILADYFWSYKSYELDGVLKGYGISPDETLNPNSSKKVYARSGLVKMTEEEIVELSKRIARDISTRRPTRCWMRQGKRKDGCGRPCIRTRRKSL